MGCSGSKSDNGHQKQSRENRVSFDDQEFFVMPAPVSEARAAAVLPSKASEDVSYLLGKIDIPRAPTSSFKHEEYLPYEKVEWVVTVEFPENPRLKPKEIEKLFDSNWRETFGHFTSFGRDADSNRWTFAISAEAPRAMTSIKLAWSYVGLTGDDPAPTKALFESRLAEINKKLTKFGEPKIRANLPPADAAQRAKELRKLKAALDQTTVLVLKAPPGRRFDGKTIWDVMLCLGLQWGDMDCFHWRNPTGEGDDALFSVETSTPPGYFLPEAIAANQVHVEDLIFLFSVPRCRAPLEVFDAMARAAEYSQRRLQGHIKDENGKNANLKAMKKRIADIEQRLRQAGLDPGSNDALRLY